MNSHNNLCTVDDSLLLIIDLQKKLTQVMPDNDADLMLNNSCKLATAASLLNIPIMATEQYPKGLGRTEVQLKKQLPNNVAIFEKTAFTCCAEQDFKDTLDKYGRKQLILVGMEAHVCILQSALDLSTLGYQVYVIEDAICSRKLEHKLYALQRMQQQGITISCVESVLFEWLKNSTHPEFKSISALIQ